MPSVVVFNKDSKRGDYKTSPAKHEENVALIEIITVAYTESICADSMGNNSPNDTIIMMPHRRSQGLRNVSPLSCYLHNNNNILRVFHEHSVETENIISCTEYSPWTISPTACL